MSFETKSVVRELLSGKLGGSVEHSTGEGVGSSGVNRVMGMSVRFYMSIGADI